MLVCVRQDDVEGNYEGSCSRCLPQLFPSWVWNDKDVSEKQRALLSGIVVALILSAYLRTWRALIFHSSTKRYFETCVPARTKEVVMSKWTMLAVAALSVSAGIFLLCSVSSLIRDFEDAFRYED